MTFLWFCYFNYRFKVRIGDVNHASNKDDRTAIDLNILGYRVHPDFDGLTSYYDVALVQTDILMFSKSISPICLPNWSSDDVNKYDNYHVELTGWGKTRLSGRVSDKLRRVSLRIYPSRWEIKSNLMFLMFFLIIYNINSKNWEAFLMFRYLDILQGIEEIRHFRNCPGTWEISRNA